MRGGYIKEICTAGAVQEQRKYYATRYRRSLPRRENSNPTPEAVKRNNIREAERKLRRKLNANFIDAVDALITLSWGADKTPPDTDSEMLKEVQRFIRKLKRIYEREKKCLRYVYTMEIGPKGSRHLHMVLSEVDLQEVVECWDGGVVNVAPLNTRGDYRRIASYFVKYAQKTADTMEKMGRKAGSRMWNSSKLMEEPKVTKTAVNAATFSERIRNHKGWILNPASVEDGISEYNGRQYQYCEFAKDSYDSKSMAADRRRRTAKAYERLRIRHGRGRRRKDRAESVRMAAGDGEQVRSTAVSGGGSIRAHKERSGSVRSRLSDG